MHLQLDDRNCLWLNTCAQQVSREEQRCFPAAQRPYHSAPTTAHTHNQGTGSSQGGGACAHYLGVSWALCSFSTDNSCIDNTYQLERYERKGRGDKEKINEKGIAALQWISTVFLADQSISHKKSCVLMLNVVKSWAEAKGSSRGRYNLITLPWLSVRHSISRTVSCWWIELSAFRINSNKSVRKFIHTTTTLFMEIICKPAVEH